MKPGNFKNRDFSVQFNYLTLRDSIHKRKNEKTSLKKPENAASHFIENSGLYTGWDQLCTTFIPRMLELDPIVSGRYLWHVSRPWCDGVDDLRSFSIVSEGLKVTYSRCGGAICAHNRLYSITDFYPFAVDMNSFTDRFGGVPAPSPFVLCSDFWRIDTQAYNGKWYIDPNMKDDCAAYGNAHPVNYLCTPDDVPSVALKCYQLRLDVYLDHYKRLQKAGIPLLSTSLLRPNEKVNDWLCRKRIAA